MATEGAKRLRLAGSPPPVSHSEAELAGLLQRLQGLLQDSAEPNSEGLDGLLEELARLQGSLAGSKGAEEAFRAIDSAQGKLQAAIVALQGAVDRYTPPPGYRPPAADSADAAFVRGLLSYAHRLSYSSSAPLGYQPGQPLHFFKPPAPQEAEMRVSQLHAFSREWEAQQQQLQAQRAAAPRGAAAPAVGPTPTPAAAPAAPAAAPAGDLAGLAAQHGLDVQQLLASMPPGWKPGDPIPLGPAAGAAAAAAAGAGPAPAAAAPGAAATPAAPAAAAAPPVEAAEEAAPPAPRLAGIFLNTLDLGELEYGVSSGEEDSDESDSEGSD